ncbi:MAG: ATP-binding protein [Candidatus Hydrogenedentes bacterium]|nr:ATP-binding protein [Candidatus Hydrogenedentota bacterium]
MLNDDPSGPTAGLFPPPPPETCLGDIDLGTTLYGGRRGYLFGLRLSELTRHLGLYGSSGCGKTNCLALIVDGMIRESIPFLLMDFKRSFRGLLRDHPNLLVFTAGDCSTAPFRWNPLIPPPGSSPENWSRRLVGAISHAYCQGAGSESLLRTAITQAYDQSSKNGIWPTFTDVSQILDSMPAKGRKGMWRDSAKRAIYSLSTGNATEVFCPERPLDLATLLTLPTVVELELMSQAEQTLLSEAILLWIIAYRLHRPQDRDGLRHAVIIEEAHHLLRSPPGVGDGTEPVIHTALREIRELGESVILATQNASIVPLTVFGNQATTLAFHTKHASDVRAVSQAMLLQEEAKDELGRLPVGEAIVRVPRWHGPIHIRIQHRPLGSGKVKDEDIRKTMAFRAYSVDSGLFHGAAAKPGIIHGVPRPDREPGNPAETSLPPVQPKDSVECPPPPTPEKQPGPYDDSGSPTPLEAAMLKDILSHPYSGVVSRINRLNTSRRKGVAALRSLEKRGLIEPETIFTGTALIKLFTLTPEGRGFCHEQSLGPIPNPTEGGILHRYLIHRAALKLQAEGWTVEKEARIHDHLTVDILATKAEQRLAVLVETGKSNVKENLNKTLEAGLSDMWIVSDVPSVHVAVEAFLRKYPKKSRIALHTSASL